MRERLTQTHLCRTALLIALAAASVMGVTQPASASFRLGSNVASIAEAINHADPRQVVGRDLPNDEAILWERETSTSWSYLGLDSVDAIGDLTSANWNVQQAHDINDDSWIVAIGFYSGAMQVILPTGFYVIALVPDPRCDTDVSGDGAININDVLVVIAAWGSYPIGSFGSPADVNTDYVVNIDDLLAVIADYCGPPCPACEVGGDSMMGGSHFGAGSEDSGPPTLAELIEIVLQSDHTPDVQAEIIQQLIQH